MARKQSRLNLIKETYGQNKKKRTQNKDELRKVMRLSWEEISPVDYKI